MVPLDARRAGWFISATGAGGSGSGPRVLAVILTGRRHDVQARAGGVAHGGGTVLAQDEASSTFFAMPSDTIVTELVNQVLALDDIPAATVARTRAA